MTIATSRIERPGPKMLRRTTCCRMIIAFTLAWASVIGDSSALAAAESITHSPSMPIAGGKLQVYWPTGTLGSPNHDRLQAFDLLIHFHGDARVVSGQWRAAGLERKQVVLAVINFHGLSSAYSTPFRSDRSLFDGILTTTVNTLRHNAVIEESAAVRDIYVSSFSAGYGAVREIMKSPSAFTRLDGYVAADSIYASIVENQLPARHVDPSQMQDFLRFAQAAAQDQKQFILSHSALTTPYASTVETAQYLIDEVGEMKPLGDSERLPFDPVWKPTGSVRRGRFVVHAFDGEQGEDHLEHLRRIGALWRQLRIEP